jgi:type II secretory pathway predicted ATPase ExeA
MFLNHFKFTSQPFAERLSADALWPDERMQQGLARLRYVAEHGTVGLVTGASGVGKSALLKRFMHELSGPGWQPVYLHLTHLPAAGMLKLLVSKLDEVPRRGKDRLFEQILAKARQAEGTLLVILDEAHLLNVDALTDIRLLISSAIDDTPPLKVVLVGQEPLRHTLRQSSQAALLSRIGVRHHLPSLSKVQTAAYIDRGFHQRNDPRLQRGRSTSDQQLGDRLSVGRICRERITSHGSHSAEDLNGIPVAVTCGGVPWPNSSLGTSFTNCETASHWPTF